jgi:DNA modification methylase
MNTLYYGDNLNILKKYIKDETIDLIYLDPPFQSGRNYNIIFPLKTGKIKGATSQWEAFKDTWSWGEKAEREYTELIAGTLTTEAPSQKLIDLMKAMRGYLTECSLLAYLCMMSPRLLELRRVLKLTGSIYLHCDPTASHYLKLLMDAVFEVDNFRNEIVWVKNSGGIGRAAFNKRHEILFFYSKTKKYYYNGKAIGDLREQNEGTFGGYFGKDKNGRKYREVRKAGKVYKYYMDEPKNPNDVWPVQQIPERDKTERVGYPTQKPEALLERILKASSNEWDLVLDPFCGCGTTIAVAEKLRRKWTGIDVTYLSIDIIKKRFEKNHIKENEHFKVYGEPKDVYSAGKLAEQNPIEFEIWAVTQLNATPTGKIGDKGVDGVINFIDNTRKEKIGRGIISVKGGHNIGPGIVRDLKGTIQSQNADFGILITLGEPTRGMIEEAVKEGSYDFCYQEGTIQKKIPKIQLLTVKNLFTDPIPVKLPPDVLEPYRKPDIKKDSGQQKVPF